MCENIHPARTNKKSTWSGLVTSADMPDKKCEKINKKKNVRGVGATSLKTKT